MSHDNPQVGRKRRRRGSGGLHYRRNRWVATWVDPVGGKRQRVFRSRAQAELFLKGVTPEARDRHLQYLRNLLWAELQARLRFGSAQIVSTKSRKSQTAA